MFLLNFGLLTFTLLSYSIMDVKAIRQKPVKPQPQPIAPTPAPIQTPINSNDDDVGEKIVVKTVVYESDSDDPLSSGKGVTHTFKPVKLYDEPDSSSDEGSGMDLVPTKKKKVKKKVTISPEMKEITETFGEITSTVTETFGEAGKSAIIGVVKTVIKSRVFSIVLFIATIFIGIGYLLKIVYK